VLTCAEEQRPAELIKSENCAYTSEQIWLKDKSKALQVILLFPLFWFLMLYIVQNFYSVPQVGWHQLHKIYVCSVCCVSELCCLVSVGFLYSLSSFFWKPLI
jgi:hypothetical protein